MKTYISPLLSLCIPTYNRETKLKISLEKLSDQLEDVDSSLIELYISDNCSSDGTENIVREYINKGLPIIYSRNDQNIGPDRNFFKCIQSASGKYIWLLGDDDYLAKGSLKALINCLQSGDYGLLHAAKKWDNSVNFKVFNKHHDFIVSVGYMITFMSANIFRSDIVKKIEITDDLMKSNLLQVYYYIESLLSYQNNVILNRNLFISHEFDNNDNGNYNFFVVFVEHYLDMWKSFVNKGRVSLTTFKDLKRMIYKNYITLHIVKILILKSMPKMQTNHAYKIIFKYYGFTWYPYVYSYKILYYLLKIKLGLLK